MSNARHYLVVGPSWVGDMVMAQSLFISLKQQHPDCEIDVLAPAWSLPVLARMPEVRGGIEDSTQHREFGFGKRWRQGRALRDKNYSHAIVLPRSWKSALVPFFANIPVRTGYKGEQRFALINDIRRLDKSLLRLTVQRYVALGAVSSATTKIDTPFPVLSVDTDNQARLISKLALKTGRPVVCMMPGAEYGPAKQWPVEYYAELAKRLVDSGRRVWVLGSKKDAVFGEVIASRDGIHNLCGKTSLVDAIDLLACAEQVVTNDSGLMHVAAATGVRINAIYGSSTPDYTPPLTQPASKNIFYLGLDCSPCFKRTCPLGHTNCLKEITVETIYADIIK